MTFAQNTSAEGFDLATLHADSIFSNIAGFENAKTFIENWLAAHPYPYEVIYVVQPFIKS
jgi:hypothetical protein